MPDYNNQVSEPIFPTHLMRFQGVSFTSREIDVIACLLNARGTSRTASLLDIAPRTVITHIRNIMQKLGCGSRESVLDFIEKSGKITSLRQHYAHLLVNGAFEKKLKEISRLNKEKPLDLIIEVRCPEFKKTLLTHLIRHIKIGGITAQLKEENDKLHLHIKESDDNFAKKESIILEGKETYYLAMFSIFQKLFPTLNLETIINDFQSQYEAICNSVGPMNLTHITTGRKEKENNESLKLKDLSYKKGVWGKVTLLVCIIIGSFFLGFINEFFPKDPRMGKSSEKPSIRLDLVIPVESVLLQRPKLFKQIDDKFKGKNGIQTVALVGLGGSGKTTLARQYARQQKASVVWELNAETHETLQSSFEHFAEALSKNKEDQSILTSTLDKRE